MIQISEVTLILRSNHTNDRLDSKLTFGNDFSFARIAENKEKNKMSSLNLSTVLCPTLFPVPDLQEISSAGSIPDLHLEATSLDLIIRQPHLIFPII